MYRHPAKHSVEAVCETSVPSSRSRRNRDVNSHRAIESSRTDWRKLPWPVLIFLVSLTVPWTFEFSGLSLSASRVVLLTMIIPCLIMWSTGRAGCIRFSDIALLLYCCWCTLSLLVVHGLSVGIQGGGILFIETAGAYLLARCYVRNVDDFLNLSKLLFRIIVIILPFAVFEAVTRHNIALDLFRAALPTIPEAYQGERWGLRRVQTVFEHPILFGVFVSAVIAMAHLVLGYQKPLLVRWSRTGIVLTTGFLSMSGGPFTVIATQLLLLSWNFILQNFKHRWRLLWGIVFVMYLIIEVGSNQSAPAFYISHFSFDKGSAWQRLLIWEFGSGSALNHPLFGVGFGEWERPFWLTGSMDMFWLVHAVRYGLPAAFLLLLAFIANILTVALKRDLNDRLLQCRFAYLVIMTGFFLAGWAVHFWGAVYLYFLFLMGSGVWLLDAVGKEAIVREPKHRGGTLGRKRLNRAKLSTSPLPQGSCRIEPP